MVAARTATSPRFIVITHEFAPVRGGAATYTEELGAALHKMGANVKIWAPDYPARVSPETTACQVVRLRAGGTLGFFNTLQLARSIASKQAELANATVILTSVGAHLAFMLLPAKRWTQCAKMISLLHGSEILRFDKNPIWRRLARQFYRRVDCVATVSEFSRSLIEKSFLHSLAGKVVLAPCAGTTAAGRAVSVGVVDGKVRVLTLARIHPRKGQLDAARALAKLPVELRQQVIYQVGGTGDETYLSQVKRFCAESGIQFEYLGEVDSTRLAEVYAGCDIYVMPSRSLPRSVEGFGITYLDAGSHGKPVVGYRSGGVAEAVAAGETGLLVAEGDVVGLTAAIERLMRDVSLRMRLGEAGRRHAERFSWPATARIFQDLAKQ